MADRLSSLLHAPSQSALSQLASELQPRAAFPELTEELRKEAAEKLAAALSDDRDARIRQALLSVIRILSRDGPQLHLLIGKDSLAKITAIARLSDTSTNANLPCQFQLHSPVSFKPQDLSLQAWWKRQKFSAMRASYHQKSVLNCMQMMFFGQSCVVPG